MRFVEPKTEDQQARAALFRGRERLLHQRTELVNAARALLYEIGHAIPQGIGYLRRIEAILEEPGSDLPSIVREECRDLMAPIPEKTIRIQARTKAVKRFADSSDTARRLQTMPGVGPLTALAAEAFAPGMRSFRCGATSRLGWGSSRASTHREARSGSAACRRLAQPTFAAC